MNATSGEIYSEQKQKRTRDSVNRGLSAEGKYTVAALMFWEQVLYRIQKEGVRNHRASSLLGSRKHKKL